jgi:hypothetical protein
MTDDAKSFIKAALAKVSNVNHHSKVTGFLKNDLVRTDTFLGLALFWHDP